MATFGATYDFGFVRPMVYLDRAKVKGVINKFASVCVQAPLGLGRLNAMVYRFDPSGSGGNEIKLGVGYFYPLSKRTMLYADASSARKDDMGATAYSSRTAFDVGGRDTF